MNGPFGTNKARDKDDADFAWEKKNPCSMHDCIFVCANIAERGVVFFKEYYLAGA